MLPKNVWKLGTRLGKERKSLQKHVREGMDAKGSLKSVQFILCGVQGIKPPATAISG